MKPIIIDMKEMSDSTEVYSSRPHPFFVIFIYFILGAVAAAFLWMYFWKLDVVVKSDGTFQLQDTVANVSSTATGKILHYNLKEGEQVQEGDLLISIEHTAEDEKLTAYENLLRNIEDRIEMMNAYMNALNQDSSGMESLTGNQYYAEFQNRGNILLANKQAAVLDYDNQTLQYQQNISSVNESISYYQGQKDKYTKALENVKRKENTFDQSDVYFYALIENYISAYLATEAQYTMVKESEQQGKTAALNQVTLEQAAAIEQQITSIEGTLTTLKSNLSTAQAQLNAWQNGTQMLTEETAVRTEKNAVTSELLTYSDKKTECESNIKSLKEYIEKCDMKATTGGYISTLTQLETGAYIQEGTAICQILPKESDQYYAEIYISNQDIGKLEEGQNVKFEIAAYPSSEYGYFTGTIETIAKDIKVDSSTGSAYYLARVHCDKSDLFNKSGDVVNVKNGMACQAKVITDEQSVLEYVLRKIDLLD